LSSILSYLLAIMSTEPAAAPAPAAAMDMSKYGTHECTCDGQI